MSFFTNPNVTELAEDHANDVLALEESKAVEILKSYQRVAAELRLRLNRLPPEIFTAQQIRVVIVQLEAAIASFQNRLNESSKDAVFSISDAGLSHTVDEVNAYQDYFQGSVQPLNLNMILEASKREELLVNQFQVSIDSYSNELRNNIWLRLNDMLIARRPAEEIHADLVERDGIGNFFKGEAWRLRRIVRTEMHGIYSRSKLSGLSTIVDKYEPEMKKALYHPLDHRTAEDSKVLMKLNPIVDIDQPFVYSFKTEKGREINRVFMAPPDRPNDRAILIPYHQSWDKSRNKIKN